MPRWPAEIRLRSGPACPFQVALLGIPEGKSGRSDCLMGRECSLSAEPRSAASRSRKDHVQLRRRQRRRIHFRPSKGWAQAPTPAPSAPDGAVATSGLSLAGETRPCVRREGRSVLMGYDERRFVSEASLIMKRAWMSAL